MWSALWYDPLSLFSIKGQQSFYHHLLSSEMSLGNHATLLRFLLLFVEGETT